MTNEGNWARDKATSDDLERMSRSKDAGERAVVASMFDVDGEMLERLAFDPDQRVRSAALIQRHMTTDLMARVLAVHPEHEVDIAFHPSAPAFVIESIPLSAAESPRLERFLSWKGAGPRESKLMREEFEAAARAGSDLTVGAAWKRFSPDEADRRE